MDIFDRAFSIETIMANRRLDKHKHEIYVAAHLDGYEKDAGLHLTFLVTNIDLTNKEYPLVIVFSNGYFYAYSVRKVFNRWDITDKMMFIRFLDENEGLTLIEPYRDKLEDLACLNGLVEGFDEDTD